jgi:hypothetical protein
MTASYKYFRAYFVILFTIFFLAPLSSFAQLVVLNANDTKTELTQNTYSRLGIHNSISEISAFQVKSSTDGNFSQLMAMAFPLPLASPSCLLLKN